MKIGYARVSTKGQSLNLQKDETIPIMGETACTTEKVIIPKVYFT